MEVSLDTDKLKNYIDGEWVEASETRDVINPATGETIVKVPLSM
jgi:aldehyde dehydrogenase (NAD+)